MSQRSKLFLFEILKSRRSVSASILEKHSSVHVPEILMYAVQLWHAILTYFKTPWDSWCRSFSYSQFVDVARLTLPKPRGLSRPSFAILGLRGLSHPRFASGQLAPFSLGLAWHVKFRQLVLSYLQSPKFIFHIHSSQRLSVID